VANRRPPRDLTARGLAVRILLRIDEEGAYANLVLGRELARSGLDQRDRAFVTDLVYGVTRLRRRLDFVVDRFLLRPVDPAVRAALRLGAYQLDQLGTPAHAAVSATVDAVPNPRARGLVNAVLRRAASQPVGADAWPDLGTRLSYPDWMVERLVAELGEDDAVAALHAMNEPAQVTARPDGYVQDLASQWVAAVVGAGPGDRVADLCAAPGGKATALAETGALVVAADIRASRVGLLRGNVDALGLGGSVAVLAADAVAPPLRPASFDRVLVDAPCSGLGALRRRPDARWRVDPDAVERLTAVQARLLRSAADLVRPCGTLVYAVCTLTSAEGPDVAATLDWPTDPAPGEPWRPHGPGALLLPQIAGTDGMFVARWQKP
jgi:16S rRNA (cytosine967-C5)-methyltransferase